MFFFFTGLYCRRSRLDVSPVWCFVVSCVVQWCPVLFSPLHVSVPHVSTRPSVVWRWRTAQWETSIRIVSMGHAPCMTAWSSMAEGRPGHQWCHRDYLLVVRPPCLFMLALLLKKSMRGFARLCLIVHAVQPQNILDNVLRACVCKL